MKISKKKNGTLDFSTFKIKLYILINAIIMNYYISWIFRLNYKKLRLSNFSFFLFETYCPHSIFLTSLFSPSPFLPSPSKFSVLMVWHFLCDNFAGMSLSSRSRFFLFGGIWGKEEEEEGRGDKATSMRWWKNSETRRIKWFMLS